MARKEVEKNNRQSAHITTTDIDQMSDVALGDRVRVVITMKIDSLNNYDGDRDEVPTVSFSGQASKVQVETVGEEEVRDGSVIKKSKMEKAISETEPEKDGE